MEEKRWWYSAFRLSLSGVFLVAGSTKLWDLIVKGETGLVDWIAGLYEAEAFVPEFLVRAFGFMVPFAEFALGVLLVLGIFRKATATFGIALFGVFLFGSEIVHYQPNMIMDIIQQVVFLISFVLLAVLRSHGDDPLSLDDIRTRRKVRTAAPLT